MLITSYKGKYKEQVIRLILDIQNNEAGIGLSLKEQPDLDNIEQSYMAAGGNFWVAVNEQNKVVGTIALMNKKNGYAILKKFFVHSDYRSQKVGLKLYLALLDFCNQHNIKSIILDTPSVASASHRFYEKNGFIQITKGDLPIPYEYPDRNSYLYIKQL
jgi:N-acetylglutamate synthase-like GNAT family acetyltransferase